MRNTVVVDTSIVIKWVLNEPDSAIALALLRQWSHTRMVIRAPALLIYEVANVLYQHIRKDDETLDSAKQALANVFLVNLEFDFSPDAILSARAIELAHQYALPATYDPHYLALAERENCEYWTADARLWDAVKGKLVWVRSLSDYQTTDQKESS